MKRCPAARLQALSGTGAVRSAGAAMNGLLGEAARVRDRSQASPVCGDRAVSMFVRPRLTLQRTNRSAVDPDQLRRRWRTENPAAAGSRSGAVRLAAVTVRLTHPAEPTNSGTGFAS